MARTARSSRATPAALPTLLKAALPALPGVNLLPGIRKKPARELPGPRAHAATASRSTRDHVAAYAAVCGFPRQGHRAADLPAPAGVPAAHGDHDRRRRSRSRRSARCTWRTRSPQHRPIARRRAARRRRARRRTCAPHAKGRVFDLVTDGAPSAARRCGRRPRRTCAAAGGDERRDAGRDRSTTAPADRRRRGGCRRPRPPVRRGVRRPQPDPPLPADRQGARASRARSRTACGARPAASRRSRTGCPTRSRVDGGVQEADLPARHGRLRVPPSRGDGADRASAFVADAPAGPAPRTSLGRRTASADRLVGVAAGSGPPGRRWRRSRPSWVKTRARDSPRAPAADGEPWS